MQLRIRLKSVSRAMALEYGFATKQRTSGWLLTAYDWSEASMMAGGSWLLVPMSTWMMDDGWWMMDDGRWMTVKLNSWRDVVNASLDSWWWRITNHHSNNQLVVSYLFHPSQQYTLYPISIFQNMGSVLGTLASVGMACGQVHPLTLPPGDACDSCTADDWGMHCNLDHHLYTQIKLGVSSRRRTLLVSLMVNSAQDLEEEEKDWSFLASLWKTDVCGVVSTSTPLFDNDLWDEYRVLSLLPYNAWLTDSHSQHHSMLFLARSSFRTRWVFSHLQTSTFAELTLMLFQHAF